MFAFNICLIQRIYYSPMQAAIRWANLVDIEDEILQKTGSSLRPSVEQLANWPLVFLYNERIFDAIIHGELPRGKKGVNSEISIDDPDLTIRHVDLRQWLAKYFPLDKPCFLFSECERSAANGHDARHRPSYATNRLTFCEKGLKQHNKYYLGNAVSLNNEQVEELRQRTNELSQRAEDAYLVIIGAMCSLIFKQKLSDLTNQESMINALKSYYPDVPGMSESNLRTKLARAKRAFTPYQKIFHLSSSN